MVVSNLSSSKGTDALTRKVEDDWRLAIIKLTLSFYFNVLLHSVEKELLDEWTKSLVTVLNASQEGSKFLTDEVARGTRSVNDNWLRVYTSDCPEDLSRS